jgi:crotonobetainyl-CoA:carnitine CoA-transferase CaiB-like acyl-CoA transferase
MPGPMEGVRVVELASWTFVPSAGAVFADWGADVIKIEDVRAGDPARMLVISGLKRENARVDRDYMLEINNRGKRSIALDLRNPAGREILAKMVETADVFLTNWLPDARRRLGVEVEQIRAINPNIIYARGSGHGPLGPDAEKGGFDSASYMARGGVAYALTPAGAERPIDQTPAFGDLPGGMTLAGGIAAALYKRQVTGEPSVVDVSLLSQAAWTMSPDIMAAEFFGVDRTAVSDPSQPVNPVVQKYRTSDDRWLQLVFLQPDRYWGPFTTRIGRADLSQDPRFVPAANLIAHSEAAIAELAKTFIEHDHEHWARVLEDEEGVWSLVASPRDVLADRQAIANGYFVTNTDDAGVEYKLVANPVRFDSAQPAPSRSPEHGEHTEQILLEFGYDWGQIADAKDAGAVL